MRIERFEDIDAWKLSRQLTQSVYKAARGSDFSGDRALRDQIRSAAGSAMHNIAEGFDAETNAEFLRFLRYAKRSCSEVQSELYVALDQSYVTPEQFSRLYEEARAARASIRGFIKYLVAYEARRKGQPRRASELPNPASREP
jgi:four helix bundle protein